MDEQQKVQNENKNDLSSIKIGYISTAFLNSGFMFVMYLLLTLVILNPHVTLGSNGLNFIMNFVTILLLIAGVLVITYQETYTFIFATHCPDCAGGITVMSIVFIISFIVMIMQGVANHLTIHTVIVASVIQFILVAISLFIISSNQI